MARMTLNREMGWLRCTSVDYGTDDEGRHWVTLTAEPKRWYALRPSFWLFAIRHLRLRPYDAAPVVED